MTKSNFRINIDALLTHEAVLSQYFPFLTLIRRQVLKSLGTYHKQINQTIESLKKYCDAKK